MPEGHSVHRLARQFQDVFGGAELAVSSPQGRFAAGAGLLDGRILERAQAHGKQLFLHFSHDRVLRVHLGLYGAWSFGGDSTFTGASSIGAPRRVGETELRGGASSGSPAGPGASADPSSSADPSADAAPPPPQGAVRVRLVSAHGWADLRGPTACEVISPAEAVAALAKLGPDPLHNEPGDGEEFARRIRSSSTSIALQLMKQDVLAGVGNIYRAETLFRRGLNPTLPGRSLQQEEALALWADVAAIMADGVHDGTIITTELPERPSGLGAAVGHGLAAATTAASGTAAAGAALPCGNSQVPREEAHYVYKREKLPCRRCGTALAVTLLAARKLYWCPSCQS
ncbi:Fpg/Nei family DNA glycosylase [Specibacter sp. NPDC057265]|uniref:Fpg/Nei family DNA glycosylase n=1 Tax=Specibacter sp. NPDC057265 TaxID=3346075 RepID=UPI0036251712